MLVSSSILQTIHIPEFSAHRQKTYTKISTIRWICRATSHTWTRSRLCLQYPWHWLKWLQEYYHCQDYAATDYKFYIQGQTRGSRRHRYPLIWQHNRSALVHGQQWYHHKKRRYGKAALRLVAARLLCTVSVQFGVVKTGLSSCIYRVKKRLHWFLQFSSISRAILFSVGVRV